MENSAVLVAGATGFLGSEICTLLRGKKLHVKAMVRSTSDPAKVKHLTDLGIKIVQGDLRNKETFPDLLTGVATVIISVSSIPFSYKAGENDVHSVDENGIINLIDASKEAGVKHFIYTSFSKNIDLDFPLRNAKRSVEEHLQRSGMTYTILRPGFFMELWLTAAAGFDALNGKVNICGTGTNPIAYISYKDVAKFAAESISNPNLVNAAFELGGPQNLSQLDAVKKFLEVLGRKIEVQHIPVEALKAQFNSAGDQMQKSFSGLMICLANGDSINMKEILKVIPVKLTSVQEYIQSLAPES
jgi:Predicted nucleoside-diphosphate-sugar epimerases